MERFDAIVVGQGLAGTTLTWRLRELGCRVLGLDRDEPATASRVAAGLVTPITGRRLALSWRIDELMPVARSFYRSIEAITGERFFHEQPALRLLASAAEREEYDRRSVHHFPGHVGPIDPPLDPTLWEQPWGGFAMTPAARLDVLTYLRSSARIFEAEGCRRSVDLDLDLDLVEYGNDGVVIPRLGVTARWLILCQGYLPVLPAGLEMLRFIPARGDILRIRCSGLTESRVIHRGLWISPTGTREEYRVGATYDHAVRAAIPDPAGRAELERLLSQVLRQPFEVIAHEAGVRPILDDGRPVLGRLPSNGSVAVLNGLGSKGTLWAPFFAEQLARHLVHGSPIEDEVNITRFLPVVRGRLTEQAQGWIREILQPGELAIDGTAGNGHDTLFLARQVGPTGTVLACDLQPAALSRTAERLREAEIDHVDLIAGDHAELGTWLVGRGPVAAAMFNLGYLPGGDKSITTSPAGTLRALHAVAEALRPGGGLSVIAYPGHRGGAEETTSVRQFFRTLAERGWLTEETPGRADHPTSPIWFRALRPST